MSLVGGTASGNCVEESLSSGAVRCSVPWASGVTHLPHPVTLPPEQCSDGIIFQLFRNHSFLASTVSCLNVQSPRHHSCPLTTLPSSVPHSPTAHECFQDKIQAPPCSLSPPCPQTVHFPLCSLHSSHMGSSLLFKHSKFIAASQLCTYCSSNWECSSLFLHLTPTEA